jgi:CHASE2 domain-containing sensor protein
MQGAEGHRHGWKRHLATGLLFVAAGLGCTRLLEYYHLLDWPSRALVDALHDTVPSTASNRVVIVAINDEDYEKPFQRRSPLAPAEVAAIIAQIRFFSPQIVGVDLDTEDWTAKDAARIKPGRGQLVWARLFTASDVGPLRIAKLSPVLGSDGGDICYGLTAMQADSDLRVRQYPGEYWMQREGKVVAYPSFPIVVQHMMTDGSCPKEGAPREEPRTEENWNEHRLLIRYRGTGHEIRTISAGVLKETYDTAVKNFESPVVRPVATLIAGSVVLLGGTYKEGRDFYATPVGTRSGVEILAHAILTQQQGGIKEAGSNLIWYDAALGVGLVLLGLRYPRLATVINVSLLVLMIPISGWIFQGFSFFLDAVPVQIGVLLHSFLHREAEARL